MNPTRRAHPDSDHHDEAQELRRIIKEQREEIERLKARFCEIIAAYDEESDDLDPDWAFIAGFAKGRAERALDGGGGGDE